MYLLSEKCLCLLVYLLGRERRSDFSPKRSEVHIPRGYYSVKHVSKEKKTILFQDLLLIKF